MADLELHSALSLRLDSAEKHASVFHLLFFFFFEKSVSRVIHYLRDSQITFFSKIFIKNGSHNTIHIFKNYFTTVFLVFSFQQNKRYLNTPSICVCIAAFLHLHALCFFGWFQPSDEKHVNSIFSNKKYFAIVLSAISF